MTPAVALGEETLGPSFGSLRNSITGAVDHFRGGRFVHVNRKGDIRERSYRQTFEIAMRLQRAMTRCGLAPGSAIIIRLGESETFVPALWAAMLGGFVAVPLTPVAERRFGQVHRSDAVSFIQAALGDVCILTDDKCFEPPLPVRTFQFDELHATGGSAEEARTDTEPGGLRLAVMTSGTTGRPRLVGLTENAVLARWWPKLPDAARADGFLTWSPFDHIMGLTAAAPNLARRIHLNADRFAADPLAWLDLMDTQRVTHATMTNFGMSLILDAMDACPQRSWRLAHVRKIGIGAEAISADLCRRFAERLAPFGLPNDSMILGYGLTECGPVAGGGTVFSAETVRAETGAVCLDGPTAGHAIRIVGSDHNILNEPEIGQIEVRGPTMTIGYLGDQGATNELFTEDNWLRTGDLGFLKDGKLTVVGREKEIIVVNAKKYSCREIEDVILARSGFRQVFAAPLAEMSPDRASGSGKSFAIFVVDDLVEQEALAGIASEVRTILVSAFKMVPAAVVLIRSRNLPRTSLGKIQRFRLGEMLDEPQPDAHVHRFASHRPGSARSAADVLERAIADVWIKLLKCGEAIDLDTDFFELGGDSVLALQMTFSLEKLFGVHLPVEDFSGALTIRTLADCLRQRGAQADASTGDGSLPDWFVARTRDFLASWPGQPAGVSGLLRKVGTAAGQLPVFWCLQDEHEARDVGTWIGARRPVYVLRSGLQLVDYESQTARAMVSRYVDEIVGEWPQGPYIIGGNCQGAIVALAIARQMLFAGRKIRLLVLADTPFFDLFGKTPFHAPVAMYLATGSKFNPYRKYRSPYEGIKKLLPAGSRMTPIQSSYSQILHRPGIELLSIDLENAIDWAGALTPPREGQAGPYPSTAYSCRIVAPFASLELEPAQQVELTLEVHNLGPVDWAPFEQSGFAVGNHWLSPLGEVLVWSDGRTPLAHPVAAGCKIGTTLTVSAPPAPGDYLLEIDMVEEGARWFGEALSIPLHIPVSVAAGSGLREASSTSGFRPKIEIARVRGPKDWDDGVRAVRARIKDSALPHWRKQLASLMLSLVKRAGRMR